MLSLTRRAWWRGARLTRCVQMLLDPVEGAVDLPFDEEAQDRLGKAEQRRCGGVAGAFDPGSFGGRLEREARLEVETTAHRARLKPFRSVVGGALASLGEGDPEETPANREAGGRLPPR